MIPAGAPSAVLRQRLRERLQADKGVVSLITRFSEDEARDDHGRWTDGGGASGSSTDAMPMGASDWTSEAGAGKSPGEASMKQVSALIDQAGMAGVGDTWYRSEHEGEYKAAAKAEVMRSLGARLTGNPQWEAYLQAAGFQGGGAAPEVKPELANNGVKTQERTNSEAAVSALVNNWALTSSDTDPHAVLLQRMAIEEFGLTGTRDPALVGDLAGKSNRDLAESIIHFAQAGSKENIAAMQDGMRVFLRAMYDQTQADFAKAGIKDLYVARGMIVAPRDVKNSLSDVQLHPLSSFTTNWTTAGDFAGFGNDGTGKLSTMVVVRVPADRVIATPRTGVGAKSEREVVLLGGTYRNAVVLQDNFKGSGMALDRIREVLAGKAASKPLILDTPLSSADWVKATWDLPPYRSPEFDALVPADKLDAFRKLPVWLAALAAGLIKDDHWVGKSYGTSTLGLDSTPGVLFGTTSTVSDGHPTPGLQPKFSEDQPRDDHGRWTGGGSSSGAHEDRPAPGSTAPHGRDAPPHRDYSAREQALTAATGLQVVPPEQYVPDAKVLSDSSWDKTLSTAQQELGRLQQQFGLDLKGTEVPIHLTREVPAVKGALGELNHWESPEDQSLHLDVSMAEQRLFSGANPGNDKPRKVMLESGDDALAPRWGVGQGLPPDERRAAVFRHELGHALDYATHSQWLVASLARDNREVFTPKWVAEHISEYAATVSSDRKPREAVAEAFAMYTAPGYVKGSLPAPWERVAEHLLHAGNARRAPGKGAVSLDITRAMPQPPEPVVLPDAFVFEQQGDAPTEWVEDELLPNYEGQRTRPAKPAKPAKT